MTLRELLDAAGPFVDGLAMTNSIATRVIDADEILLFDGQPRGICGRATREASIGQTRLFAGFVADLPRPITLVGVGGAATVNDVHDYLQAGASSVHIATAAMLDPAVALQIRRDWNEPQASPNDQA